MILYHYCGVETFLNIIKFHTLRLSDLCQSTDSLELKSLMEAVEKEVVEQYRTNNNFLESVFQKKEICWNNGENMPIIEGKTKNIVEGLYGASFDGDEIEINKSKSSYCL